MTKEQQVAADAAAAILEFEALAAELTARRLAPRIYGRDEKGREVPLRPSRGSSSGPAPVRS
jgi:hypothetical protein